MNALARKRKAEGLTEAETAEQAELRRRYLKAFREGMEAQLDQVWLEQEDGSYEKLRKKQE
ncbi:MAG: DUF896 domain-containing protein [Clostridiales bacterium]|nr:DUF896 domain-containing protein [Clostridiales bacterium]